MPLKNIQKLLVAESKNMESYNLNIKISGELNMPVVADSQDEMEEWSFEYANNADTGNMRMESATLKDFVKHKDRYDVSMVLKGTVPVTVNAENEEKALKLAKEKALNTDFGELENIQIDRPQKNI